MHPLVRAFIAMLLMACALIAVIAYFVVTARAAPLLVASVYWEDRWIATGARFDKNAMAVAHKTLALGTMLNVTHGRKNVAVTVNDRGPFIRGRSLDFTPAVAKKLGCPVRGLCRVKAAVPLPKPRPDIPEAAIAWGEEGDY